MESNGQEITLLHQAGKRARWLSYIFSEIWAASFERSPVWANARNTAGVHRNGPELPGKQSEWSPFLTCSCGQEPYDCTYPWGKLHPEGSRTKAVKSFWVSDCLNNPIRDASFLPIAHVPWELNFKENAWCDSEPLHPDGHLHFCPAYADGVGHLYQSCWADNGATCVAIS